MFDFIGKFALLHFVAYLAYLASYILGIVALIYIVKLIGYL